MSLRELSVNIALTQVGVQEVPLGSNKGPEVEKYLKSIGLGGGFPWCMAFVYWCVNEAAIAQGVNNPLHKTGGVLLQLNKSKHLESKDPVPGSIFIMDFGNGKGHAGFVEKVEGNVLHTIEGNTNAAGSREGDRVVRRTRNISQIRSFINI